jgi:hypothetical protein
MHLNKRVLSEKTPFHHKSEPLECASTLLWCIESNVLKEQKNLKMLISHQIVLLQVHTKQKMIELNKKYVKRGN